MTGKERAALRSAANGIDTILIVGKEGITDNVIVQADDALKARELIKGKVLETSLLTAREACTEICARTGAEPIQCIGSKFVIYRKNPEKTVIVISR